MSKDIVAEIGAVLKRSVWTEVHDKNYNEC